MLIMALGLTFAAGMAALVAGDVGSAAIINQSERAYYKAESYVEQGLWEKKKNTNYSFTGAVSTLPQDFLCTTAPCFLNDTQGYPESRRQQSGGTSNWLTAFKVSSQAPTATVDIAQDQVLQYDIDMTNVTTAADVSGRVIFPTITPTAPSSSLTLEVSVIAYQKTDVSTGIVRYNTGVGNSGTPVFIDKKIVTTAANNFLIGTAAGSNPLAEVYPALSQNTVYRLRVRALGGSGTISVPQIQTLSGKTLNALTPDLVVDATAEDGQARRRIQVITPLQSQVINVFDFVLFSDASLIKATPKIGTNVSVTVNTRRVATCGTAESPLANVGVSGNNGLGARTTDATGTAVYTNVGFPGTYTFDAPAPAGMVACGATSQTLNITNETDQTVTFRYAPAATILASWLGRQYASGFCVPYPSPPNTLPCVVNGNSVYDLQPYYAYYQAPNATTFAPGNHTVRITYSNFPYTGLPVPASYSYNVTVYAYWASAGTWVNPSFNLPISQPGTTSQTYDATFNFPNPLAAGQSFYIILLWNNDSYTPGVSDANFQIDRVELIQ
jgi:hypothetical protein